MYLDLHNTILELKSNSVSERVAEFCNKYNETSIVAVGGFPIIEGRWCGNKVSHDMFAKYITDGLGLSAVPTFMNKSKKSLNDLGKICFKLGHDWGLHWISVSILFVNEEPQVELAFARDGRFKMGWPLSDSSNGRVWVANASIKDWLKYTKNFNDKDFDKPTRDAMRKARLVLQNIVPGVEVD